MKNIHVRSFEIDRVRFHLTARTDGLLQLTSIHPYDDTEYHWAILRTPTSWDVYRKGRRVTTLRHEHGTTFKAEEAAAQLLNLDAAAHLTPRRAIW